MKASKVPTVALVFAAFAALIAVIMAVLLIGEAVHLDGPATREGSTRVSLIILLFGQAVMTALFAAFLFIGVEDWRRGVLISDLYPPQVAVMGTMAAYMTVTGLSVIDLLTHHLRPTWGILYTPVARIFQSVLLLTVFASFAWVLATVIRGRSDDRRRGGQTIAMRAALRRIARRLKRVERDTHIAKEHVNDLGARPPRDDRGGRE
jgi:hypothetical protein